MWDDFHPYVFKTTDSGAHWSAIDAGIPSDDYVYVIRQDPAQPNLLFAGTKTTVRVSFDGGQAWQPLTLNLPGTQVRDLVIDSRQGQVAIATHGRAFWVMDNLALLEQLAAGRGQAATMLQLFAPQTAWLTHMYGGGAYPRPDTGENPPFGATVFFNMPHDYRGKTAATLTFMDAAQHVIRRFTLHPKTAASNVTAEMREQMSPAQIKAAQDEAATAIAPGMNAFQWDLRYPDATEVNGFYVPSAAGGENDFPIGPQVTPGSYTVTLSYGGQTLQQPFTVSLDPNLHPASNGLEQRFALQLRIRDAIDSLDKLLNEALAARDRLPSSERAALDEQIDRLVNLQTHSSEGPLSTGTRVRDHLAYLQSDVDFAYGAPTVAQYAVFAQLLSEAHAGEARLRTLMQR